MKFLWKNISDICKANGSLPAGDSACGFGNTAMVLAERGMIPKVFAAVVRVATVARALAAFEEGAVGLKELTTSKYIIFGDGQIR